AQHGRLDILVNNAGMNIRKPLIDIEEDDWDRVLNTNLKGIFLVGQAAAKQMIKQKYGKIINISSIFGGVGMPFQTSYAASKGGINQLTKVWASELAPYNINVNAIAPAYIRTPMTSAWLQDEERYRNIVNSTMLNRVGEPEDVTGPVVFLASDAANYITGHILYVDGGWTAK
ncbi:SDR family NAD(P)-dependent oxidoreductase, partial [Geobacillus jurassicus]|uniref:SDR family NAD(P)-dependent oxidoreductase n=1 Tax=Geobacillus jurassicus TaxID=235932 RepID=UPI000826A049